MLRRTERMQHAVVVLKRRFVHMLIGRRYHIGWRSGDDAEHLILPCRLCDQRHIVGTGIVIFILKPVRIVKMRILAAQFRRLLIHHGDKVLHGAADVLRHRICTLIRGFEHDRVKTLLQSHLLSDITGDTGPLCLVYRVTGKSDRIT